MIFDKTNLFSDDQAVTSTAASTNVIDLGASDRNISIGDGIPVFAYVTADFNTLTSLQMVVQTDDDEGFGGAVNLVQTADVPLASLTAGYQFLIDMIPLGVVGRYIRISWVVTGTPATLGTITAGVTAGNQQNV